mmetsp:Transcript_20038/g.43113  ORF Transcript_20038/g.43113 Transcript_20038/m.43113 type:complete len:389 (+) Transcript_20038:161-1327(+)
MKGLFRKSDGCVRGTSSPLQKEESSSGETRSTDNSTAATASPRRKSGSLCKPAGFLLTAANVRRSSGRSVSSQDSCSSISLNSSNVVASPTVSSGRKTRKKVNRRSSLSRFNSEPVLVNAQQNPLPSTANDPEADATRPPVSRALSMRNVDSSCHGSIDGSTVSTSMFHHSLLVDKTWGQVKSFYLQSQQQGDAGSAEKQTLLLGEQIVLHMMERDPAVRQSLNITSFRSPSPRLDELCKELVALVDQLVSFMGPDMMMMNDSNAPDEEETHNFEDDFYTEELTLLAQDCQSRGIQFHLLGPAIEESIALVLSGIGKPLRDEDRQAWTQFLRIALAKMQKLLVTKEVSLAPTSETISIPSHGASTSSLLTASSDGDDLPSHAAEQGLE